ncbi:ThiI family thiazole biosynthesis protein [Tetragenococcus muriaticus PMC-11-5]|uniref:ThiI family thiazole biosynthesis protein n=1 Tax=Tetragenococcus muriaticus PMC-11-5 TaxID=1302649 RepID=A0A091C3D3_9ENTE|nr:ThiI family thiazole biosynthesis protein [Tetragenococcus muriaticus PMC-11-5]
MKYSEIMVRYGELSTKGKNRRSFIMQLASNVRQALIDFPALKVHADRDRMHLILNGEDSDLIIPKLQKVFGIQNFSPSIRVEKDLEQIKQTAQEIMKEIYTGKETFKVTARRSDHTFEQTSDELNVTVGDAVMDCFPDIKVQMKQPDINLRVEIRSNGAFLSYETILGAAGLPVGTSGKGMLMLSRGDRFASGWIYGDETWCRN